MAPESNGAWERRAPSLLRGPGIGTARPLGYGAKSRLVLRPIVKRGRIEIGSAWPNDGVNLRIERHLSERRWVVKRTVKLALKNRLEVNSARQAVVEMQAQRIRRDALKGGDAVNWVIHGANLPQRLDWGRLSALYQKRPIGEQFFLATYGPLAR
jgi:hypothetical protein